MQRREHRGVRPSRSTLRSTLRYRTAPEVTEPMSNAAHQGSAFLDPVTIAPPSGEGHAGATFRLRLLLREVTFDADEVTIGRATDCALSIDDDLLSRRHAVIVRRGDAFEIVDLGSRNGTKLNGTPVHAPTPLRPGDRIRLGRAEVVFVHETETANGNPQRRLATASYLACLACEQALPAEMVACSRCGTPTPARI